MKTKRHAKIMEIVTAGTVATQEELQEQLLQSGFKVTQATISRDIKELRLVKTLGADGIYRYATVRQEKDHMPAKFHALFVSAVMDVDYACNMVVIKCYTGMAQAACAALDSLHRENVVGTLAGDDTFVCIMKSENEAIELAVDLKKILKEG